MARGWTRVVEPTGWVHRFGPESDAESPRTDCPRDAGGPGGRPRAGLTPVVDSAAAVRARWGVVQPARTPGFGPGNRGSSPRPPASARGRAHLAALPRGR